MFTWICPKCGKEVPPSYSECPNCAASAGPPAAEPASTVASTPAAPPAPVAAAPPPAEPRAAAAPPPFRPAQRVPAQAGGTVAVPWWLLIVLIALGFGALGFGFISWHQQREAPPATAAAPPVFEQPSAAGAQTTPEFRDVELTGLRLTEDGKQKPFVQFIIVNHSATDLGDLGGTVNLRAVTKQDREPVGTFSFKTKLGPYESKDIRAPLETKLRVYELPDWQFLRAEIAGK